MPERLLSPSNVLLFGRTLEDLQIVEQDLPPAEGGGPDRHNPFVRPRTGVSQFLQQQLLQAEARIARIYGFSYEGTYYDLPRPVLFLVHGEGVQATEAIPAIGVTQRARAPGEPSLTGVAAADFQFSDDVMAWSYDKADYTIRMDVETGMFEQVLLDVYFGGAPGVSGAHVSGAHVSGAHVSGAHVSGAHVSGAHLGGARGRGRGRGGTD